MDTTDHNDWSQSAMVELSVAKGDATSRKVGTGIKVLGVTHYMRIRRHGRAKQQLLWVDARRLSAWFTS